MEGWGKSGVLSRKFPTGWHDLIEHLLIVSLAPAPLPGTPHHYFTYPPNRATTRGLLPCFIQREGLRLRKVHNVVGLSRLGF